MWEGSIKWIVFPALSMGPREKSISRGRPCLESGGSWDACSRREKRVCPVKERIVC